MARKSWTTGAADEAAVAGSKYNQIHGTPGNDNLVGTDGRDRFTPGAGNDTLNGLGGRDWFVFGESYTKSDHVDGGEGNDTIGLGGRGTPDTLFDHNQLESVERFYLGSTESTFTFSDGFQNLIITGNYLGATVDASALTTGSVRFVGFHPGAELIGGSRADTFFSNSGPATFTGGGGRDRFVYNEVGDSSRVGADLITDFDTKDVIRLPEIAGGYHVSATADQKGEIVFSYNGNTHQTLAEVNLDGLSDHLMMYLSGDLELKVVHGDHIVFG